MYKRKFEKGPVIRTLDDLISEILSSHYVYVHDKPQHHGWMINQHLFELIRLVRLGVVSIALPTEEYWRAKRKRAEELEAEEIREAEMWAEEHRDDTGDTPEELGLY